nr:retrovirus-related Pol polyprotein from transposon TNT 1-94 [Tanacetum cinerariifolium]
MKSICNIDVPVDSQAPKTSSQAKKVPQGKKPGAKRCDASADSIAEADPGLSASNDFIPSQQEQTKSVGDRLKTAHTYSGTNEEFRADKISKKIKLEDLSNLLKVIRSAFFTPNSPQDEPIIVSDESKEEKTKKDKDTHATFYNIPEDTLVPHPPSPKSAQIQELMAQSNIFSLEKLKTLDSLLILLNNFIETLNRFATMVENASGATTKDVPLAGQATASPAEGEKNNNLATMDAEPNLHDELVDLLGIDVVTQYYNKKLLYDKYCDKMLKRRKSSKITNCNVLTQKGPISLIVHREDGTIKAISNVKVSDLHLAEWRKVGFASNHKDLASLCISEVSHKDTRKHGHSNSYAHAVKSRISSKGVKEDKKPALALDDSYVFKFQSKVSKDNFLDHIGVGSWFSKLLHVSMNFIIDERVIWIDIEANQKTTFSDDDSLDVNELDENGRIHKEAISKVRIDAEEIPETNLRKEVASDPFSGIMTDADKTAVLKANVYKKAHSALLLCLDNKVLREVNKEDSTAGVWLKLETLYMTKSLANKLYLKKKLFTFYMDSGKKLSEHIDKFNKLIGDLANIDADIDDEDQVLMLLTTLPSSYDNFVETFLYGGESLTLEDVLSSLNSRELKKRTDAKDDGDGLYVKGRLDHRGNQGRGSSRLKSKGKGTYKLKCYICYSEDHLKKDCSNKQEEINWLCQEGCRTWFWRDFLFDFKEFNGGTIFLGDNRACTIMGARKVRVQMKDGSSFVLENVCYIPDLKRNLISLGTLDREGSTVKLQNGPSPKPIGHMNKASKLKRLQKFGTTQRIETSDDIVMDDVSKQGRIIADMDADKDVTLQDVVAKDVQDAEMEESSDVQGRKAESQAQIYQINLEHANIFMII